LGACLHYYGFNQYYYAYLLYGEDRFPSLLAVLADLDYLILDDYGYKLSETSNPTSPAQMLIQLVQGRIREGRPTIINVPWNGDKEIPQSIANFLRWLRQQYPTFDLGPQSWRGKSRDETVEATQDDEKHRYSGFLSQGWLSEKLQEVEHFIERSAAQLAMSEEEVAIESRGHVAYGFPPVTKEILARESLRIAADSVRDYRNFIESLPWSHIAFDNVPFGQELSSDKEFLVEASDFDQSSEDESFEDEFSV
jgi:hypothetical protein